MKSVQPALLTLYADLLQQLQQVTAPAGSVRTQDVKGKEYLKANFTIGLQRRTLYIGRATDPEAKRKAVAVQDEMQRAKARRQTVGLLRRGGIPAPTAELGRVLEVLALADLFRKGAVLVGTAAYQCFSPLVGTILPAASMMTQDVDLATASLALAAGDGRGAGIDSKGQTGAPGSSPSLEEILQRADPTFAGIPGLTPAAFPSHFRARSGLMVDVLTPLRSRADPDRMPVPALSAAATPLQHLDWLIDSPSPAVALYGAGVLVQVPQPARYAVHKLILAQKRGPGSVKRQKDLDQAKALIDALKQADPFAIEDALEDARGRGERGWRDRINRSLHQLGLTELATSHTGR
ncbi:MAG: GSU2403 family nucleotidyltransferase fold protein [Roseiarcus sp.]|uniref:GSU2403 family nucleotidyltransferase fold protein n=1 Tax=Roseiarcus sp. TaxID=1969460 RepID=UPI003C627556